MLKPVSFFIRYQTDQLYSITATTFPGLKRPSFASVRTFCRLIVAAVYVVVVVVVIIRSPFNVFGN
jgi:hypothetical protein